MRFHPRLLLPALLPVALILLGSPPAGANGFCVIQGGLFSPVIVSTGTVSTTTVVVIGAQTTRGFTPTILDAIAFPTFPLAPVTFPMRSMSPGVVCPAVVVVPTGVTPVVVNPLVVGVPPLFVDPPGPGQSPATSSPSSPPPLIVAGAPQHDTVADLAGAPSRYDRQVVNVAGTIGTYDERFTDRDVRYASFRLEDGGASVPVVVWGHPGLRPGLRVRVIGTFHDVAPFVLAGGDRPSHVLEAQVIGQAGGDAPRTTP